MSPHSIAYDTSYVSMENRNVSSLLITGEKKDLEHIHQTLLLGSAKVSLQYVDETIQIIMEHVGKFDQLVFAESKRFGFPSQKRSIQISVDLEYKVKSRRVACMLAT